MYDKANFEAIRNNLIESKWEEQYVASANDKTIEELWTSLNQNFWKNLFLNRNPRENLYGKNMESFPLINHYRELFVVNTWHIGVGWLRKDIFNLTGLASTTLVPEIK